ncbi:MAG: OmpA family protein [Arcobacter sp.]|jgi:chemotaxis protein MotB|uniref:OmpA domain-containing protein n=1 Tax=Arcobacter defluvii TaxID=873191 RepID=A0AAE7BBP3_9BACT|nr:MULTISPECIES: OmpA family protein [Arcobacter]MDY3199498.1 OmpA family protein [Arcobacter sp.]QKF76500.1 OmpA domain-containing protein [Arcobacter defluvii]RXI34647.1 chemotaxis protein [Arcobacter defluvii]
MYNKEQKNDENFWISYADLMAGLLFVFILVIGAIVIKYVYTQSNLEKEKAALNSSEEAKSKLFYELAKAKNLYETTKSDLDKAASELKDKDNKISLNLAEIEKLKALLLEYELNVKDEKDKNEKLSAELTEKTNMISLKDEELTMLADKLLVQTQIHQKMVEEFDIAKLKIKNLTGIKLTVIAKLKEKLGKSINIDEKSGAIKFSSNILFDQNSYILKENAKKELSNTLKKYLNTLLGDKEMKKYIESITIEGHTNSDGTYLSNLSLSQQRAHAVMQFLYDSNIIDKNLLSTYVNSSGRSSSDLILDKNGVEDKDASRRIEIKFTIKNEEAIREIQNYLGEKK